ncbi:MAG TPA: hypothetical protein VG944_07780 [Fimbriimonas sp.]|nr:hypothetical protein [Fimbriimonas sp.]
MRRLSLLSFAAVSGALLAGCGGGSSSGSGTSPDSAVHTVTGPGFTATYQGKITPAAQFDFNGVSVQLMAGANLTQVNLMPTPQLGATHLAFILGNQIWGTQPGNESQLSGDQITNGLLLPTSPSYSHNGQIAFSGMAPGATVPQIYLCNYDGSNLRKITTTAVAHLEPSWNYQNNKLTFRDASQNIYTVSSTGTSEAKVGTITGLHPVFSPDGTKIAYSKSSGGKQQIFTATTAGSSPTLISTSYATDNCNNPAWSPDSTMIAFDVSNGSSLNGIAIQDATGKGGGYLATNPQSGTVDTQPCFSPDSANLAFARNESGFNVGIFAAPIAQGSTANEIVNQTSDGSQPTSPAWSPFPATKAFIGTGGIVPSAGGFMWTQVGDAFGTFAAFVATTPSTCTITPQTTSFNNAAFLVKADAITKVVYTNDYYGALTGLTFTGVTQMLVTGSALSGQIDVIAPLAVKRTAAATSLKPSVSGTHLIYKADFSAVYSKGKNVAPSGASQIEVDKKGNLVSWH